MPAEKTYGRLRKDSQALAVGVLGARRPFFMRGSAEHALKHVRVEVGIPLPGWAVDPGKGFRNAVAGFGPGAVLGLVCLPDRPLAVAGLVRIAVRHLLADQHAQEAVYAEGVVLAQHEICPPDRGPVVSVVIDHRLRHRANVDLLAALAPERG